MSITLDEFIESVTASGIMDAEEVESFLDTLPMESRPRTAEELAKELYRLGKLTKFQAQAIYQKKTRGLVVGNYVVLDKLGKGGMGAVYKARHKRMDRIVALKMLPSSATRSQDAVQRFQRETRAAAKLSHPNIVTAYDADEAKGVYFLVMEYVDGQDLHALVKEHGTISAARAVDYIVQAAKGLEYAHSQGVIHRDIKPHNLLLDKKGTVKILDMGLARIGEGAAGDAVDDDGLTRSGQVMGTLDYMSPEQALDTKTVDVRTDIYSLGCTLHYLLIGRSPYGGDTVGKKMLAHRMEPIPSLRKLRSDAPESLDAVFHKMMAKEPKDRQQSMSEVIRELQACAMPQGNLLVPPSLPPSVGSYAETVALPKEDTAPSAQSLSPLDELFASQSIQITERLVAPSIRKRRPWTRQQKVWTASVAGSMAFVLLLLGVVLKIKTSEGTLVVEISEPDAAVQVLNEQGKVLIERKGQKGTLTIGVDPGKRRLRVEKDGFEVFAREFSIASGGKETIKAKLEAVAAGQAKDPDRRAAEWVLAKGGTLGVVVDGQGKDVKTLAELPQGEFKVGVITLSDNKSVGDELFAYLKGLTGLGNLSINGTQVTTRGLEQLRDIRIGGWGWLELSGTAANDATLGCIGYMKGFGHLGLDRTAVTDAGLAHLEGMVNLSHVGLEGTKVSDAGLKHLGGMKQLRYLLLSGTQVTDDGLAELRGLELLVQLLLNETKVGDAGIDHLRRSTSLERLDLRSTQVTGRGLEQFKNLKSTNLCSTKINDDGLKHLAGLTDLEVLILQNTPITDVGLGHLKGLTKLQVLNLNECPLTDKGLEHLKGLQNLIGLSLGSTQVTAAGVAALQAALPKCKIAVDPAIQAELEKMVKPSSSTPSATADRKAAEWVLAKGGTLSVTVEGQEREVKAITELPNEGFKVVAVSLSGNKSVGDDVFTHLKGLTDLRRLNLEETHITSQGLEQLKNMGSLEALNLRDSRANDAALGHLRELKRLTSLDLHRTAITDVGLGHLEGLVNLVHLELGVTQVSSAGLKHLRGLKSLRFLSLPITQVTDEGLVHLQGLESLADLNITGTKVTDTGLQHLAGLTKLRAIVLTGLPISDAGLEHLRGMKKLANIALGSTRVTDQGLQSLKALQELAELQLEGSQVTAAGVAAFQAALPKCKVNWEPPPNPSMGAATESAKPSALSAGTPPALAVAPFDAAKAKQHQDAWAKHLGVSTVETNSIGMKLILIPPGQFMMGTPDSEVGLPGSDVTAVTFGRPQHAVEITRPFYLGMFEVTQEEYEKVIGSNPSLFKGDARRPVELVSWSDAVSFCNRLSQRERMQPYYKVDGETVSIAGGAGYRLPTEAEWEHACRAGTTTKRSFGDDASMVGDYAWFVGNAGGGTHKVGEKKPNPWGLYDVHGNVWEWCWDWMYLYEAKPAKDPVSPPYGGGRVLRGGAFTDVAGVLRSAERQANSPGARHLSYGFRTARSCK